MHERDKSIDFIKGLSIIGIILCHGAQVIPELNKKIYYILQLGQLGCQTFFFFSGYLMTLGMGKKSVRYIDYIKGKIKGIIIPWYIAITFYFCITIYVNRYMFEFPYKTNTSLMAIIINMLFLNGIVPAANNNVVLGGWYIGTTVIIWLLFPLIYNLNKKGPKSAYVGIFCCIFFTIICGLLTGETITRNTFWYFSFINQLPCVLYGIKVCQQYKNREFKYNRVDFLKTTGILIIVLFLFYGNLPFGACFIPILVSNVSFNIWQMLRKKIAYVSNMKYIKFMCYLGENSLYIYLFHVFCVFHVQWMLHNKILNGIGNNIIIKFFLMMLICFSLTIVFAGLVKKVSNIIKRATKSLYNILR